MILEQVLNMALDLLEHPEFKNYGDLQKSRYQNSKSEDEIFLKSDRLKNSISTKRGIKIGPQRKEAKEKGRITRKNWYKDPKNRAKFMEKIKDRDKRNRLKKGTV